MLEGRMGVFTRHIIGDMNLDAPGAILQGGEAGLAHHPFEHHAPGHSHAHPGSLQRLGHFAAILRLQACSLMRGLEIVGEGGGCLALGGELGAAFGDERAVVRS